MVSHISSVCTGRIKDSIDRGGFETCSNGNTRFPGRLRVENRSNGRSARSLLRDAVRAASKLRRGRCSVSGRDRGSALSVRRRDSWKESNLVGSFETKYYRSSLRRYSLVAPVEANSNDNTGKKQAEAGNVRKND